VQDLDAGVNRRRRFAFLKRRHQRAFPFNRPNWASGCRGYARKIDKGIIPELRARERERERNREKQRERGGGQPQLLNRKGFSACSSVTSEPLFLPFSRFLVFLGRNEQIYFAVFVATAACQESGLKSGDGAGYKSRCDFSARAQAGRAFSLYLSARQKDARGVAGLKRQIGFPIVILPCRAR